MGCREVPVKLLQHKGPSCQKGRPAPSCLAGVGIHPLPGRGQWLSHLQGQSSVICFLSLLSTPMHRVPEVPGQPLPNAPSHEAVTWSGTRCSARASLSSRDRGKPASSSSSSWSSASLVSSSFLSPHPGPRRVFLVQLQAPQPWASGSEEAFWSQASVGGGKRAGLRKGHMVDEGVGRRDHQHSPPHQHLLVPWCVRF